MQALDTKARAEIKTVANRASSLQPREKQDLSARGQRDVQLLIRDALKWSKALKGTVLNMLVPYFNPGISSSSSIVTYEPHAFAQMDGQILASCHACQDWSFPVKYANSYPRSLLAGASTVLWLLANHQRPSKAKHRRSKRKWNGKESWQWSQQDGMFSCFSESHLITILICHFQSISRHESNFCRQFMPWRLNSLWKQSDELSSALGNSKKCQARPAAVGSLSWVSCPSAVLLK